MTPDICVFVEGTYPYVIGGVSAWLHNLITKLPEFTFTICHLGSKPEPARAFKYEFPSNVVGFQEIFLNDSSWLRPPSRFHHSPSRWQCLQAFHGALVKRNFEESDESFRCFYALGADRLDAADLLYAPEAWDLLVERYKANSPAMPFSDYFWNFRSTHLPLFVLHNTSFPKARLYHTISTGYAGYAAALAKLQTGAPLLITEHGIYTREREMEIALATWMDSSVQMTYRIDPHIGIFKAWWTDMFRYMSRFTYQMCDTIVSITKVNQQYQLREGAEPQKLRVIPNGIEVDRFKHLRAQRNTRSDHFTVGYVGRIVPIKDVKIFIQAMKIASATIPGIRVLIIGPTDEDTDYFEECQELVALLELAGIVRFTGRGDVREYYPELDVLVLTSLTEAQPLVVLEANCAGIPVVASDVGACRELLEGITAEDKALGPSGLLTLPASPHETAEAVIRLWKDEPVCKELAQAGQERVQRFYREEAVDAAYRDLYQGYLHPTRKSGGRNPTWQA